MAAPVGGAGKEFYSFNQLQDITKIMESSDFKGAKAAQPEEQAKPADTMDVIIISKPGAFKGAGAPDPAKVKKNLKKKGVDIEKSLPSIGGVAAKVKPEQAEQLKSEGYLIFDNSPRSLMPDVPRASVNEAQQGGKPWDMPKVDFVKMTGADALISKGFDGTGQTVAVVDSGFEKPDFKLKEWHSVFGVNKQNDPVGHGTHCSGIVHTVAPEAEIVAVQVMNPDGSGRPSDIIEGIEWVTQNKERLGITAMNLSLGGAPDGYPYYYDPINMAVEKAWEKGILVVSAAGNSGPEAGTIGSPADDPTGLAVGAALNPKKVSDFSSRGPTDDGIEKPDVLAPGEYIVSWNVPDSQMGKTAAVCDTIRKMGPDQLVQLLINKPQLIEAFGLPEDILEKPPQEIEMRVKMSLPPMFLPDKDHLAGPGTSFAAPIITGIGADLKEKAPSAGPTEIKEALMDTAENMGPQYGKYDQGKGFVNAKKAGEMLQG